jgi:hypothetical protein
MVTGTGCGVRHEERSPEGSPPRAPAPRATTVKTSRVVGRVTDEGSDGIYTLDDGCHSPVELVVNSNEDRVNLAGASALSGFEYQIDVSIWLALDLVLASKLAPECVLEPLSQEDFEA